MIKSFDFHDDSNKMCKSDQKTMQSRKTPNNRLVYFFLLDIFFTTFRDYMLCFYDKAFH